MNKQNESQTNFSEGIMSANSPKIPVLMDKDDIEIAGKLRNIIAEVEAIASSSNVVAVASTSKTDLEEPFPNNISDPRMVVKPFIAHDNEDKTGLNLPRKMETINVIPGLDMKDIYQFRTINSHISNERDSVTVCDSVDKQDFDLTNKLYKFIAEATDEMTTEDMCYITNFEGENQHSELSNLVADAVKTLEMEASNQSNTNNKPSLDNCSAIVAMDIGGTSIYLSSFDNSNEDIKKDNNSNRENGIAEKAKFVCHHCYSEWSDYYSIKSHIVWNHIPELEKKHVYRIIPNMNNIPLVNQIFDKLHNLKVGKWKSKTYFPAFKCRIVFTKRRIKNYKCQHCVFNTSKEYEMRKHKVMKHNKLLYQCTYCNYCTTTQSCLQRHIMAKHTKEKPHKCKFCDYCATQYITLQEHVMAKHTFEKPHQCSYCDYASVQRSILKDHLKSKHTHERKRSCPNCSYVSVSSATLRRHIMARHTHEKPYKCDYCDYSATQSGQLRKHIMAIHTNKKPFHCTSCSYKATQSYTLKLHIMRRHSIERPYQCNHCQYKCSTNTYLKYHIQNKHK